MKSLANSDALVVNCLPTCSSASVPCILESAYGCQSQEMDGDTWSCWLPAPGQLGLSRLGCPACPGAVLLSLGPNFPVVLGAERGSSAWHLDFQTKSQAGSSGRTG